MCVCFACLCTCVYTCISSSVICRHAHQGQKRASNLLELKLQAGVSCHAGAENHTSGVHWKSIKSSSLLSHAAGCSLLFLVSP